MNTSASSDEKRGMNPLTQMQKDLDAYLVKYNQKRPHQGRNMNGMTPWQAFKKGLTTKPQNKGETVEKSTA